MTRARVRSLLMAIVYAFVVTGIPTLIGTFAAPLLGWRSEAGTILGLVVGLILYAITTSPSEKALRDEDQALRTEVARLERELRRPESSLERTNRVRDDDRARARRRRFFGGYPDQ